MKCLFSVMCVVSFLLSASVNAEVAEGENLLLNGSFNAGQAVFPKFWTPTKNVFYDPTGGPDGKPSIILKNDENASGLIQLLQSVPNLVEGETYKLSVYIKTKGFKSKNAGIVLLNKGWKNCIGFGERSIPADSEWTLMEKTFKLFSSEDKYHLSMFAVDLTGEIHFADVKLEAVSEGARKGPSLKQ